MIKLQRLGHVLMTVRDLNRSKRFYVDILGFTVLEEDPEHGGLFLTLGDYGNTLDIFPTTNPEWEDREKDRGHFDGYGVRHTAFQVATEEDLKDAYAALGAAGVKIEQMLDHGSQKSIYFKDPDFNMLEIVWERPDVRDIYARGRSDQDAELTFP